MYFAVGNISNFDKHDLENHLSREGGGGGGELAHISALLPGRPEKFNRPLCS